MAEIKDRVTVRLGDLRGPLAKQCERLGVSPSEYLRNVLAERLGVEAPKLRVGNPNMINRAGARGRK